MNFLEKSRVLYSQVKEQIYTYLISKYNVSRNTLTPASPFIQILNVLDGLFSLTMFYTEDAIQETNLITATKQTSVYGLTRLTGHNPGRAKAASGTISIKFNQSSTLSNSYVIINNYSKLKCLNNGLSYVIVLDNENIKIPTNTTEKIYLKIFQGEIQEQVFIGDNEELQSHNIQGPSSQFIDDSYVNVYVNGEKWDKYESLYDLAGKDVKGVIIKTGITGGIDGYFGNGYFGKIPELGSIIKYQYLNTLGYSGNIYSGSTQLQFEWEDLAIDLLGNDVDLNENFMTFVEDAPIFGANAETIQFTKLIAPNMSKSFVLANTDNYIYYLQKLNLFSYVDAYTTFDDEYLQDDNVIYLFLIPDIKRKLTQNTNYFTIDDSNFVLDDYEKVKLLNTINEAGIQVISTELVITKPILKKYVININLRIFEGFEKNTIKTSIINKLSDYFLTVRRRDRIPKSDLISIIENIEGIDSVSISFISNDNETAIRLGYYTVNDFKNNVLTTKTIKLASTDNPNLGLDEFGDIVIGRDELPIIRGGFTDRNGVIYENSLNFNKPCSINITIKDIIKNDLLSKFNKNNKALI